jgi:DNA repair protein RadC
MALTEKEVEKKTLSEIGSLERGYQKKMSELASHLGSGMVKPADMMALNADLAILKKVKDKKMKEQSSLNKPQPQKKAAPLKSYEDFMKNKKK